MEIFEFVYLIFFKIHEIKYSISLLLMISWIFVDDITRKFFQLL